MDPYSDTTLVDKSKHEIGTKIKSVDIIAFTKIFLHELRVSDFFSFFSHWSLRSLQINIEEGISLDTIILDGKDIRSLAEPFRGIEILGLQTVLEVVQPMLCKINLMKK